jgi:ABC-type branched-subunit amino acid transport system ATPase component/ABC-type branched-subunit amino acid transport system permease subunit
MDSRARAIAVGGGFIALALVPALAAGLNQPFYLDLFRRIMIFAIAAVSLDLILGYGGMVSFGHAAYLGLGAYAVAIPAHYGIQSGLLQWPLAIVLSGVAALLIGAVSLRTSGVSFIMITLAFAQMLYYLGISINAWGADDGMRLARRSEFAGALDLANPYVFYYVVLAILTALLWLGHRLIRARFGVVIRASRSNEARMRAIGFSTFRYRLAAFALAGAMCGLAGALLTNQTEYLTPSFMHWTRSGEIMVMVILGGMGTLFGPVLGAVALCCWRTCCPRGRCTGRWCWGRSSCWSCSTPKAACGACCPPERAAMADAILQMSALTKRFGGLVASDGITLDVAEGETLAIIGPNGAGKTTLIGQLAGNLRPDAGTIRFAGEDVTALGAPARSQRGLARSFQVTSIFRDFTALDNIALAVQAHAGHSFRFWRPAREEAALREPARAILERVGLGARAEVLAGALAHGEQRQLEIGMALATKPKLLLLDEPVAGMGVDESQRMVELLRELRGRLTLVLVEHDMDAVFALADRISVLVYGRVIASGAPEAIRANPEVRRAYLGEDDAD